MDIKTSNHLHPLTSCQILLLSLHIPFTQINNISYEDTYLCIQGEQGHSATASIHGHSYTDVHPPSQSYCLGDTGGILHCHWLAWRFQSCRLKQNKWQHEGTRFQVLRGGEGKLVSWLLFLYENDNCFFLIYFLNKVGLSSFIFWALKMNALARSITMLFNPLPPIFKSPNRTISGDVLKFLVLGPIHLCTISQKCITTGQYQNRCNRKG